MHSHELDLRLSVGSGWPQVRRDTGTSSHCQLELSSWRGRFPEKASRLDDSETPASFEDARCSATATASVKHPLSELLTSSETILCAEAQIVS